jgi:deazaflavin-dependent oxidoreductase (nitroreductase family)
MSEAAVIPRHGAWVETLPSRPDTGARTSIRALIELLLLRLVGTVHRLAYRISDGRLGRSAQGGPVLLLTTIGRRTGRERTWPLCYIRERDALVLVASAGGAPRQPGWYLNLQAQPRVTVQIGDQTWTMRARTAEGSERTRLWGRIVRHYPVCAGYQGRTSREIPVVALTLP